jgi:uncharacterized protein YndB with AHSA1/START domain
MADIRHELPIQAPPERVFEAIATPEGLAFLVDQSGRY